MFNDEDIASKFEVEEIEGRTLQSERILTDAAMNSLGLSTIGKKDKFAIAVQDLFGKFNQVTLILLIFIIFGGSSSSEFCTTAKKLTYTVLWSFRPIILNQFYETVNTFEVPPSTKAKMRKYFCCFFF